jgi:hypothetical protein
VVGRSNVKNSLGAGRFNITGILCRSNAELATVVATRQRQLGMTMDEANDYLGLQSGYLNKLTCLDRQVGEMSLGLLMNGFHFDVLAVVREPSPPVTRKPHWLAFPFTGDPQAVWNDFGLALLVVLREPPSSAPQRITQDDASMPALPAPKDPRLLALPSPERTTS